MIFINIIIILAIVDNKLTYCDDYFEKWYRFDVASIIATFSNPAEKRVVHATLGR